MINNINFDFHLKTRTWDILFLSYFDTSGIIFANYILKNWVLKPNLNAS